MMQVEEKYKQTELGVIPYDWEVKTINEAFDVCNNLRLPISEDIRNKVTHRPTPYSNLYSLVIFLPTKNKDTWQQVPNTATGCFH